MPQSNFSYNFKRYGPNRKYFCSDWQRMPGLPWSLLYCPSPWASYQISKIAGCACAGNAGNVFPRRRFQRKPLISDPGMHHGTCVTHVPWCMSGSLTCGYGENVPGIPGACAPAILRIWQEAHGHKDVGDPDTGQKWVSFGLKREPGCGGVWLWGLDHKSCTLQRKCHSERPQLLLHRWSLGIDK